MAITGVYLLRWPITKQGWAGPFDTMLLDQNLNEIMLTAAEKQRATAVQMITIPNADPEAKQPKSWTAGPINISFGEPERMVLYRLNCIAYSSGTINYRMSQSGQATSTLSLPLLA